jgi:hypothetical protein
MITDRVRARRAGSSITIAFLAREMGREAGREFLRRRAEGVLVMHVCPYSEPLMRKEWDLGFWQVVREAERD